MNSLASVSFKIDKDLKDTADLLFENLGLDLNSAIKMFIRQSIREGAIPFRVKSYDFNKETIEALLETRRIANDPNARSYSVEEALAELKK